MAESVSKEEFAELLQTVKQLCWWTRFPVSQQSGEDEKISNNRSIRLALINLLASQNRNVKVCEICGVMDIKFLTIDHKYGNGGTDRKFFRNDTTMWSYYLDHPEEALATLRILCWHCNSIHSTRIGMKFVRFRGKQIGRPNIDIDKSRLDRLFSSGVPIIEICNELGVCKATLYKHLRRYGLNKYRSQEKLKQPRLQQLDNFPTT